MAAQSAKLSQIKNDPAKELNTDELRANTIHQAREHIARASVLLRPLGIEFARIAWMFEDSLAFIDEAAETAAEEQTVKRTVVDEKNLIANALFKQLFD